MCVLDCARNVLNRQQRRVLKLSIGMVPERRSPTLIMSLVQQHLANYIATLLEPRRTSITLALSSQAETKGGRRLEIADVTRGPKRR